MCDDKSKLEGGKCINKTENAEKFESICRSIDPHFTYNGLPVQSGGGTLCECENGYVYNNSEKQCVAKTLIKPNPISTIVPKKTEPTRSEKLVDTNNFIATTSGVANSTTTIQITLVENATSSAILDEVKNDLNVSPRETVIKKIGRWLRKLFGN